MHSMVVSFGDGKALYSGYSYRSKMNGARKLVKIRKQRWEDGFLGIKLCKFEGFSTLTTA